MERRRESRGATWIRRSLIAVGVAIVAYLIWTIWDYEALMRWMEDARPVPFFIAMAALPALGFPFTPLYLLAGATFDTATACAGTAIAVAVNLAFCYAIGRSSLRPRLIALFERFGYELPDFDAEAGASVRRSIRFATIIKATPGVPSFVKNYGLGAARVPFSIYFTVGMVFSAVYAFALIMLGDSLFDHEIGRGTIVIVVFVALALLVRWWSRRRGADEPMPALGT